MQDNNFILEDLLNSVNNFLIVTTKRYISTKKSDELLNLLDDTTDYIIDVLNLNRTLQLDTATIISDYGMACIDMFKSSNSFYQDFHVKNLIKSFINYSQYLYKNPSSMQLSDKNLQQLGATLKVLVYTKLVVIDLNTLQEHIKSIAKKDLTIAKVIKENFQNIIKNGDNTSVYKFILKAKNCYSTLQSLHGKYTFKTLDIHNVANGEKVDQNVNEIIQGIMDSLILYSSIQMDGVIQNNPKYQDLTENWIKKLELQSDVNKENNNPIQNNQHKKIVTFAINQELQRIKEYVVNDYEYKFQPLLIKQ